MITTLALFFPNIDAPTENRRPSAQLQAGFCRELMGDGLVAGAAALDRGDCPIRGVDCASMRSGWTIEARMTSQIGKEQRSGVEGISIDRLSHTLIYKSALAGRQGSPGQFAGFRLPRGRALEY